ncbi:MAG: hypothetical protein CVV27_14245 [Candidatus Melainabacteria bacterium HGW-Melainabacteria-1]|nr:MAG: hypothetical protein CVV27_14245 [Candidatus Melainabacteria bacterium HGW-Melainabacteria-1]
MRSTIKHRHLLLLSLAAGLLTACQTSTGFNPGYPTAMPSAYGSAAPGGLASLLTGQVVGSEEQQLRDIQKRQILLDFPVKVGVVFYQLSSKLEATDLEARFDELADSLKATGMVRETIQVPSTLVSGSVTIEELRRLGARFQTDILVLINGSHSYQKSKSQNLSFFDSFSDKASYESEVKLEAIALDVFTGTLLSPFDAAVKSTPQLLDQAAADFAQQTYTQQKSAETQAWQALQTEAIERLTQLKAEVDKRKADLATASPMPQATAEPTPSATPMPSPVPSPSSSPVDGGL